jgi:CYTH domain
VPSPRPPPPLLLPPPLHNAAAARHRCRQKVLETLFVDSYWDTADHALARRDAWLRLRAGAWELKTPLPGPAAASAATAVYREVLASAQAA